MKLTKKERGKKNYEQIVCVVTEFPDLVVTVLHLPPTKQNKNLIKSNFIAHSFKNE